MIFCPLFCPIINYPSTKYHIDIYALFRCVTNKGWYLSMILSQFMPFSKQLHAPMLPAIRTNENPLSENPEINNNIPTIFMLTNWASRSGSRCRNQPFIIRLICHHVHIISTTAANKSPEPIAALRLIFSLCLNILVPLILKAYLIMIIKNLELCLGRYVFKHTFFL